MNTNPLERLQGLVRQHCEDAQRPLSLAELAADANDLELTDEEILGVVMAAFEMERDEALARLEAMDIANMWVLL